VVFFSFSPLPVEVGPQFGHHVRIELGGDVVQRGELDGLAQELRVAHAVRVDA
jgi:hypothetical protein